MKKLVLIQAVVAAVAMLASGCSSSTEGKKYSCDEICTIVGDCEGTEAAKTDCLEKCALFEVGMRTEPYNIMGRCMLNLPCEAIEICLYGAIAVVDPSVTDGYVDVLCDKELECDNVETKDECLTEMGRSEIPLFLSLWDTKSITCVTECTDMLVCPTSGTNYLGCFEECGVVFFGD